MSRFAKTTAALLLAAALIAGCASRQTFEDVDVPKAEMDAFLADKPEELEPAYRRLLREGPRNAVLNQMRVGLDAYQLGYKELSERAFDNAVANIQRIYADNETARKARSLWYEEGMKDFKGEPYERAMAFYYRGLLFLEEGDYENARAAFKSAILQDAFAEEEQSRCDFALLILLEAWASKLANSPDLARVAFEEVKRLRPDFEGSLDDNVLVIIETGTSPRKLADGPGHSELKFRRGKKIIEKDVVVSLDGTRHGGPYPMEDIFWQSTSRGGRPVDKIVQGKAKFRQVNARMGSTLTEVANTMMFSAPLVENTEGMQAASAALGLVGVAQMAMAQRARPHADTRYWNNLPDTVWVYSIKLDEGKHSLKLDFLDAEGNVIRDFSKTVNLEVGHGEPSIVWVKSRKVLSTDNKKRVGR